MAKRLIPIPMNRGIDQSKATGGGEDPSGLVSCVNLWHNKRGELTTRPGTNRDGGIYSSTTTISAAEVVGNTAIMVGDGNKVSALSRPVTTGEFPTFTFTGRLSDCIPVARHEIGEPDDIGTAEQLTKNIAIWRHLLLIAEDGDSNAMFVRAYDRTTGALLTTTVIDEITDNTFCWAHHGDAFAPSLFVRDDDGDIQRHLMSDSSTGAYDAGTTLETLSVSAVKLLAVGHTTGGAHVALTDGRTYYTANQEDGMNTVTISGQILMAAWGKGDGVAWFAGTDTGTLTVRRISGLVMTTGTQAVSESAVALAPQGESDVAAFMYDGGGAPGNTYRCIVNGTTAVIGAEVTFMYEAAPRGGAMYDNGRGYIWFTINNQGVMGDPVPFMRTVLIATGSSVVPDPETVLIADVIALPGPATELLPQAGWDGRGNFTALHQGLLDLEVQGSAKNVAFVWTFTDYPVTEELGGRPLFSGGIMSDLTGTLTEETLPVIGPRILSVSQGTTGSLTLLGAYQFVALYERRDSTGTVRRSTPGQIVSVTMTGSNDSVTVTTVDSELIGSEWEVVIYRTQANGTEFYRDSIVTSALAPGDAFTSTQSDISLSDNSFAYFEGGELFNGCAPSHSILVTGKNRAWVAGQWRKFRLQFSKETIPGEVPGFPDSATHWMDLQQDITGLAVMDDVVLAFHKASVTMVTGDGPDARGLGSFQTRPCTIGIGADDHRSICVTPIGVFFAGQGTIWLMGRGFSAPENVGALVQDLIDSYPFVLAARLVDYGGQQCVQFICQNYTATQTTRLVFSLRSLQWYQWDALGATALGSTIVRIARDETKCALLNAGTDVSSANRLVSEITADVAGTPWTTDVALAPGDPQNVTIATSIQTHDVHTWGIVTDARVHNAWTRAVISEEQDWTVARIFDGGAEEQETSGYKQLAKPGYQVHEFKLKRQALTSLALRFEMGPVTLAGLMLEMESEGAPKLPTANKRG